MLLFWLSLAIGAFAAPANKTQPTASVASGQVVGTSIPGVNQYLGIPFAASPPVRFAPPSSPAKWGTLQATSYKPACVQQFNDPENVQDFEMSVFNAAMPPESEDCLYLNVFAPSSSSTTLKPVMFWIYGGNLQFGSASLPAYNGSSFAANQDVVVVTSNYRSNVFGFLPSPEIPTGQQNLGFLDQRFALQWVQDNIKAFGGDPTKVTIFGESAGGYSVKQLLANPPSPLPFRAAIMESEAATTTPSASYVELLALTNCTLAASQVDCLRHVPATTLKSLQEEYNLAFPPVFDNVTAVENTGPVFAAGKAAKVPFMLGTNANEGTPFAYAILLAANNVTVEQYLESVGVPAALATTIVAAYPFDTVYEVLSAVLTDLEFLCPASLLASTASTAGYDVWRYFYNATFPNLSTFPGAGAYHSSEIVEVFGTYPTQDATAGQIGLSTYMQTAWANFAKNPGSPGWPEVSTGVLGKLTDQSPYETTIPTTQTDARCALYAPLIAVLGI